MVETLKDQVICLRCNWTDERKLLKVGPKWNIELQSWSKHCPQCYSTLIAPYNVAEAAQAINKRKKAKDKPKTKSTDTW